MRLTSDGKTQVKSLIGASLSVLMIMMVLAYAGYKSKIFIEKSRRNLTEAILRSYYTQDDQFTND